MAKYDAVDRLMSLATNAKTPAKGYAGMDVAAEDTLKAKVSASEPGVPVSAALTQPQVSASDRGRQLLGAVRPFLPALGGALRLVDHGAVQTIARLLPLLGSLGSSGAATTAAGSQTVKTGGAKQSGEGPGSLETLLTGLNQRQVVVNDEFQALQGRFSQQEEQLRRIRESQERLSADQGTLSHLVHQLKDRSRLLTACVVILLMLVIAMGISILMLTGKLN